MITESLKSTVHHLSPVFPGFETGFEEALQSTCGDAHRHPSTIDYSKFHIAVTLSQAVCCFNPQLCKARCVTEFARFVVVVELESEPEEPECWSSRHITLHYASPVTSCAGRNRRRGIVYRRKENYCCRTTPTGLLRPPKIIERV